jgi:type I restriction enzyme R subunit
LKKWSAKLEAMSKPTEHKTVQARILEYAEAIGWTIVSREEAEERRGGIPAPLRGKVGDRNVPAPFSLFFDDLLDAKVRVFNPRYAEAEGALLGRFRHLHTDIYGNREFVEHLRNRGKFFDHEEKRERDLILIDYDDLNATPARRRNVYEVTDEWAFHNGHYGTQQDVVFLINGIPVLVIECKNANKDEAIGLGVGWNTVRRNLFNWKLEGGHSCPPVTKKWGLENPHSFFNPHGEIDVTQNHLPHWQQGEAWVFVTWRLGDSLPKAKLDQWKNERDSWMAHHPEPWDKKTEAEYHERFSHQIDEWLDQGSGSCLLKDPANAKIVAHALRHFNGDRYELASFVVMPNHVHVLFRPLEGHALPEIVKSWKGFTSREINKRAGKTGALWQDEYWDRLIRHEQHFFKVAEYIRENPVKAKLEGGHSCPPFLMLLEKERGLSSPRPIKEKGGHECPPSVLGRLEAKVKTFCAIPQVLAFLKDYIVFAENDLKMGSVCKS